MILRTRAAPILLPLTMAFVGLLFAACARPVPTAELTAPETARTGQPIRVHLSGLSNLAHVTVSLYGPDGKRYDVTRAFPVGDGAYVALFGLHVTAPGGTYLVRARVDLPVPDDRASEPVSVEREIAVSRGAFPESRISLGPDASNLRATPDPEKVKEARELLRLVAQYRLGAVYERDAFVMPIEDYRITAEFGNRRTYVYANGETARSVHWGLDLIGPTDDELPPVRAAGAGRVAMAKERIVTGKSVVIEHLPGVYGHYYHLKDIAVEPGERVARGQVIGTMGATGVVTGGHLHWEMRVGGVQVAPRSFVGTGILDTLDEFGNIESTIEEGG
jgi:murein DD-endopeptidase MepM/ murein hydrolase activator NlpD